MIKICPAILESSVAEFNRQLTEYSIYFKQIDIDVIIPDKNFKGEKTVDYEYILNRVGLYSNDFGLHLMVSDPFLIIDRFSRESKKDFRFYIHQKVVDYSLIDKIKRLADELNRKIFIGLVINPDENIKDLDYYLNFSEVQFMTVNPGLQGANFLKSSVENINVLRGVGYRGEVSVDGGINPDVLDFLKSYKIDRLSIGSYFSKAKNVKQALDFLINRLGKIL